MAAVGGDATLPRIPAMAPSAAVVTGFVTSAFLRRLSSLCEGYEFEAPKCPQEMTEPMQDAALHVASTLAAALQNACTPDFPTPATAVNARLS